MLDVLLIQSGGGKGPVKPRQPQYFKKWKVPIPANVNKALVR